MYCALREMYIGKSLLVVTLIVYVEAQSTSELLFEYIRSGYCSGSRMHFYKAIIYCSSNS